MHMDKQVIGGKGLEEGKHLYLIYSSKNSKMILIVKIYKMTANQRESSGFF